MVEQYKIEETTDVHVHGREPGQVYKAGFRRLTKDAAEGGIGMVCDMPNTLPQAVVYPGSLLEKIQLAQGNIYCDVGFYLGGSPKSIPFLNDVIVRRTAVGLKIYMNHTTGDLLIEDQRVLEQLFEGWNSPQPIVVHAERENNALANALDLAKRHKQKLHVAHVSTAPDVYEIMDAQDAGVDVTGEAAPHHIALSTIDYWRQRGQAKMKPPLANKKNQPVLIRALKDNRLAMIATDHAPHTDEEKRSKNPPFGVKGLKAVLPIMLTFVHEGVFDMDDIDRLMHRNPKQRFNLPAQDNTYTIVEIRDDKFNLTDPPYSETLVNGRVLQTVIRNSIVYQAGELGEPGHFTDQPTGEVVYPLAA